MIKNPNEPYIGPKGLTKREYIVIEMSKVLIPQHGLRAGLWHAKQYTERLINFDNELKKEEEKKLPQEDEEFEDE